MNPPYWKDSEDIESSFRPPTGDHSFRTSENDFVVSHVPQPPRNSSEPSSDQHPQPPLPSPLTHISTSPSQHTASTDVRSTVSVSALTPGLNPPRLVERNHLESSPEGSSVDESIAGTRKKVSGTKRAVQNRNAQRAFRQRKEKYMKELEARVAEMLLLHKKIDDLQRENRELRDYTMALQSELLKLTHNMNNEHKG